MRCAPGGVRAGDVVFVVTKGREESAGTSEATANLYAAVVSTKVSEIDRRSGTNCGAIVNCRNARMLKMIMGTVTLKT